MSLRKRGNTWQVSVSLSGRRIRISAGKGATREQAQEFEAKIRRDLLAERLGRKPKKLISEALNYWLDGERKTLRARDYENKIAHTLPYLQGRYLEDTPEVAAQAARVWLAKGL